MHDAFRRGPVKLGLSGLKGSLRGGFVTAVDRGFDLFDVRPHAAHPRAIDGSAFLALAETLFRRFMVRHPGSPASKKRRLYRRGGRASTKPANDLIIGCGTQPYASRRKRPSLPSGRRSRRSNETAGARTARPRRALSQTRG